MPADEPENQTLAVLREMRGAMVRIEAKVDGLAEDLDDLRTRVDGNTLVLNMAMGVLHAHDERLEALEGGEAPSPTDAA